MSKGTTGDRSFKRPWSKCEQSETLVRVRESLFKVVSYNFICGIVVTLYKYLDFLYNTKSLL